MFLSFLVRNVQNQKMFSRILQKFLTFRDMASESHSRWRPEGDPAAEKKSSANFITDFKYKIVFFQYQFIQKNIYIIVNVHSRYILISSIERII